MIATGRNIFTMYAAQKMIKDAEIKWDNRHFIDRSWSIDKHNSICRKFAKCKPRTISICNRITIEAYQHQPLTQSFESRQTCVCMRLHSIAIHIQAVNSYQTEGGMSFFWVTDFSGLDSV